MSRNISKKNEMPISGILGMEIFNIWDIDFTGPFPSSYDQQYILVVMDYVSKCIEAIALLTNDRWVMISSRGRIFSQSVAPCKLLSVMVESIFVIINMQHCWLSIGLNIVS